MNPKRPHRKPALAALTFAATLVSALASTPALACKNPSTAVARAAFASTPETQVDDPYADDPELESADSYAYADGGADYLPASGAGHHSIVGMWHAILRIGDAKGFVFDEILEQFHSDGTEMIISNGLPPALGNICAGVWKRTGARSYKLKHLTWNWSPDDGGFGVPGTFAGHFELVVNLRLDPGGDSFKGRWKVRNYDTEGKHLPDLDAKGVITGKRISVH